MLSASRTPISRLFPGNLLLIYCALNSSVTDATERDAFKPFAAINTVYDSNFLRLSNGSRPAFTQANGRSEILNQLTAGFDWNWKINRQALLVNADINQNWFQNFSVFNYTGWNALAQWNWQAGNTWSGEVGYADNESLGTFTFINNLESNLKNTQRYFGNANWLFHPNGRVKLGVYRTHLKFDAATRQINNNIETTGEFALQYLSPIGSTAGIQVLVTDGQFPQLPFNGGANVLDNQYQRLNFGGTWDWQISVKSRFFGFLGYTEQNYRHVSTRNFGGFIGRLGGHWQSSEKLGFGLTFLREIYQSQDLFTSFLLSQGVEQDITWKPAEKINVSLLTAYRQQDFLGGIEVTSNNGRQQDNVVNVGLNAAYTPMAAVSVNALLNYEKRNSNNPLRSYNSLSASLNIKVTF